MKILIIEDQASIRLIMRRYLEPFGYPIEEAETLAEGLAFMRKIPPPDLVYLDLKLPDSRDAEKTLADGMAAIRAINPQAVIVVMTGDVTATLPALAGRLGADVFRQKLDLDSQRALFEATWQAFKSRRAVMSPQEMAASSLELLEKLAGLLGLECSAPGC